MYSLLIIKEIILDGTSKRTYQEFEIKNGYVAAAKKKGNISDSLIVSNIGNTETQMLIVFNKALKRPNAHISDDTGINVVFTHSAPRNKYCYIVLNSAGKNGRFTVDFNDDLYRIRLMPNSISNSQ